MILSLIGCFFKKRYYEKSNAYSFPTNKLSWISIVFGERLNLQEKEFLLK